MNKTTTTIFASIGALIIGFGASQLVSDPEFVDVGESRIVSQIDGETTIVKKVSDAEKQIIVAEQRFDPQTGEEVSPFVTYYTIQDIVNKIEEKQAFIGRVQKDLDIQNEINIASNGADVVQIPKYNPETGAISGYNEMERVQLEFEIQLKESLIQDANDYIAEMQTLLDSASKVQ